MDTFRTNFELLLAVSELSAPELMRTVGAERSQISRWRSGGRKLVYGHHWAEKIADAFIMADLNTPRPFIAAMLADIYPQKGALKDDALHEQLVLWLTDVGQYNTQAQDARMELYLKYMAYKAGRGRLSPPLRTQQHNMPAAMVEGYIESQGQLNALVHYVSTLTEPRQILFVCPEGIDIITRNEEFSKKFLKNLIGMLQKGHTLSVVLRADFKMSDVSSFAGPWLVAHLLGYIQSFYYDDFQPVETDRILVWVEDEIAARFTGNEWHCETYTDMAHMEEIEQTVKSYLGNSVQRFRYNLFPAPGNYLKSIGSVAEQTCYLFQRLPHVSIGGERFLDAVHLNEEEKAYVLEQFKPLFLSPDQFEDDVNIYHMFCLDDIEDALDKPRHRHRILLNMLGRRVYVDAQTLVNQLVEIKRLLKQRKNYHVSFMAANVYERIMMEVGVWGDKAAIGWIQDKQSTATKDYTNTRTLHGFCSTVWNKIPRIARGRGAANRALNRLLNRAKRMGYTVHDR